MTPEGYYSIATLGVIVYALVMSRFVVANRVMDEGAVA